MFLFGIFNSFAQTVPVTVINETLEIKDNVFHIRAYKGDILNINIQTELKNEKKAKYYELNNVIVYKQNASDAFQYIINKSNVSKLDVNLVVPSDGIYTIVFDRGGLTNFTTALFVQRNALNDSTANLNKQAVMVSIPDTVHNYTEYQETYDYIRTATPYITKQRTPQYTEDQIFFDVSYAMRIDNIYAIPIVMPVEIMSDYKIAKSIKWGFFLSVSDEVYKALQAKVGDVATAAIDVGVGKAMSGKVDDATGVVNKSSIQKGYDIFDQASTANAIAGITGDIGSSTDNEPVTVSSDVVQTITGFTGLSETAGSAIGSLMPKIEDEIIYKVMTQQEYKKYRNGEPYTVIQQGKGCYAQGEFDLRNPNQVYYLVIENERSTSGGFWDVAQSVGKTMLSQYVYTNLKVFVQRKVEVTYDKGYYENTYKNLTNPNWSHTQEISSKNAVIFLEDIKPYYTQLNSNNIY